MAAKDEYCDVVEGASSVCCNINMVDKSIFDNDIGSIESDDPFGPCGWDGLESFCASCEQVGQEYGKVHAAQ